MRYLHYSEDKKDKACVLDILKVFLLGFDAYKDIVAELYSNYPMNIRRLRPLWRTT